jgi:hypothetical protein
MRNKELLGMAAAIALVSACKDDTERVTLANCETGPKAGIYETTIPNTHRVKLLNMQMLAPENDIVTFPNYETNILLDAKTNNKVYNIHIEPVSPTENAFGRTLLGPLLCKSVFCSSVETLV